MGDNLGTPQRVLLAVILVGLAFLASGYAVFVAVTDGVISALPPIVFAGLFWVNCMLYLTGRAFPAEPDAKKQKARE
jgi:hypothetical protein